jgi:hypothetical protein
VSVSYPVVFSFSYWCSCQDCIYDGDCDADGDCNGTISNAQWYNFGFRSQSDLQGVLFFFIAFKVFSSFSHTFVVVIIHVVLVVIWCLSIFIRFFFFEGRTTSLH